MIDLSKITDAELASERGRRNAAKIKHHRGGVPASCTCGRCKKCKQRLRVAAWRARKKAGATN